MGVEDIILSPEAVFRAISMIREKEILSKHKYCIYQGQDGKWYTYLPDSTKPGGRRKVKKPSYDEVKIEVIKHYESESIYSQTLYEPPGSIIRTNVRAQAEKLGLLFCFH